MLGNNVGLLTKLLCIITFIKSDLFRGKSGVNLNSNIQSKLNYTSYELFRRNQTQMSVLLGLVHDGLRTGFICDDVRGLDSDPPSSADLHQTTEVTVKLGSRHSLEPL